MKITKLLWVILIAFSYLASAQEVGWKADWEKTWKSEQLNIFPQGTNLLNDSTFVTI